MTWFGVAAAAVVSLALGDDVRGETCVDICEGDFGDTCVSLALGDEVRGETCVDICEGDVCGVSGAALAAYLVMSSCSLPQNNM